MTWNMRRIESGEVWEYFFVWLGEPGDGSKTAFIKELRCPVDIRTFFLFTSEPLEAGSLQGHGDEATRVHHALAPRGSKPSSSKNSPDPGRSFPKGPDQGASTVGAHADSEEFPSGGGGLPVTDLPVCV